MQRRAYDAAGTTQNVKVTLNGQEIPNKHFASYAALYGKGLYFKLNERWECVIMSANQRPSLSFVNGICTPKGGTHVKALTQPVLRYIAKTMTKRLGSVTISPTIVAEHVCFLINCIVENPTFDSQCKETLTLKADAFGSEPVWDDNMLKKTLKCGVEESLTEWFVPIGMVFGKRRVYGSTFVHSQAARCQQGGWYRIQKVLFVVDRGGFCSVDGDIWFVGGGS